MTKLIGIKELQTNIKKIRKEAEKGITFIVLYRSHPVFEIKPIAKEEDISESLAKTSLYKDAFIKRMQEAEKDLKNGNTKNYSTEEFIKSL